ncbi:MAG: PEP-CTERM sorting domain-containing protein [Planctomycetota bacterium]
MKFAKYALLAGFILPALAGQSAAQVFDSGPSDPGLFDTVTNIPPSPDIGDSVDIGGVVGQTIQVNVGDGGSVGNNLQTLFGGEVNISGGVVGIGLTADGGEVNILGGTAGDSVTSIGGGQINFSGGSIGDGSAVFSGSEFNMSGGTIGTNGAVFSVFGGVFNLSGGTINNSLSASADSEVNIVGTAFTLDGLSLDSLVLNQPTTITKRDVTLSGTLADGNPFSFDLNTTAPFGEDFVPGNVTLTVTLVPEPGSLTLMALGAGLISRRRRISRR